MRVLGFRAGFGVSGRGLRVTGPRTSNEACFRGPKGSYEVGFRV